MTAPRPQRVARNRNRKWKRVADSGVGLSVAIDRSGDAVDAVRRMREWWGLQPGRPTIHRESPGDGRHGVTKADVARFIRILPDWDAASHGLKSIRLGAEADDCDGWYRDGNIVLCAWPNRTSYELDDGWYHDHRGFLRRIGADLDVTPDAVACHWTDSTVRAYLLLHVFLHELGHHVDRVTCGVSCSFPGGEEWAERFAFTYERLVWELYVAEFGRPG